MVKLINTPSEVSQNHQSMENGWLEQRGEVIIRIDTRIMWKGKQIEKVRRSNLLLLFLNLT